MSLVDCDSNLKSIQYGISLLSLRSSVCPTCPSCTHQVVPAEGNGQRRACLLRTDVPEGVQLKDEVIRRRYVHRSPTPNRTVHRRRCQPPHYGMVILRAVFFIGGEFSI